MGTRADFYLGRGKKATWLGSIAWDGHTESLPEVCNSTTKKEFLEAVKELEKCDDWTDPEEQGWPWPWNDSRTTDYAYAFDRGKVWASCFGHEWQEAAAYDGEKDGREKVAIFPDMSARKNVTMGKRSGVMVVSAPRKEKSVTLARKK